MSDEKQACVCCDMMLNQNVQPDQKFCFGISMGMLYAAENLPLRLCETHTGVVVGINNLLRTKYEELNGYPLSMKQAAVEVTTKPKGPSN